MQIKAGQIKQARANIKILEKEAKREIEYSRQRKKLPRSFDSSYLPLRVAMLWKQAGEQKRCNKMLQSLPLVPSNFLSSEKLDRIHMIFQWGFVDEGLRRFHALSAAQKKEMQKSIPYMASKIVSAHPNQFPQELIQGLNPHQKLNFLNSYVDSLTAKIFQGLDF